MTDLRLVFAGTPEFAACSLAALLAADLRPLLVLTQPDRPAGRGRRVTASPVKQLAVHHEIEVYQPRTLKDEEAQERLEGLQPDFLIVAAYGLLLPQSVLDIARLAPVNVHASLLPRWRGAAPIQAAIRAGDSETGIALMKMEAGLDTGPVYSSASLRIGENENAGELHDRLAPLGGELLCRDLQKIATGECEPIEQDETQATYAPRLSKADALIDWQQGAEEIARAVRAYNPWPVAHTTIEEQPLRVWAAHPLIDVRDNGEPGELRVHDDELRVATGDGWLQLTRVQLAGRKQISAADFARQRPLSGLHLGR